MVHDPQADCVEVWKLSDHNFIFPEGICCDCHKRYSDYMHQSFDQNCEEHGHYLQMEILPSDIVRPRLVKCTKCGRTAQDIEEREKLAVLGEELSSVDGDERSEGNEQSVAVTNENNLVSAQIDPEEEKEEDEEVKFVNNYKLIYLVKRSSF